MIQIFPIHYGNMIVAVTPALNMLNGSKNISKFNPIDSIVFPQ